MSLAISGDDTVQLIGRTLSDLADDDVGSLTFPNDVVGVKVGKNGNALFALNESGRLAEMVLRIVRGSQDDKFLNSQLLGYLGNPTSYVLLFGTFTKKLGDGSGNTAADKYVLGSGLATKIPEAKSNVSGDTTQGVALWHLKFAKAVRVIT